MPKIIKKGTMLIVTDGEYSDYTIEGYYEVLEDITLEENPAGNRWAQPFFAPLGFDKAVKMRPYTELHFTREYTHDGGVRKYAFLKEEGEDAQED